MIDNTVLKEVNEAVLDYATTATRKAVDLQTALFKDWIALNKKLIDLSPAKEMVHMFSTLSAPKK
jgi:hypothetical protein